MSVLALIKCLDVQSEVEETGLEECKPYPTKNISLLFSLSLCTLSKKVVFVFKSFVCMQRVVTPLCNVTGDASTDNAHNGLMTHFPKSLF